MPGPYPSSANADDIVRDLAQYIRGKVILVTGVSPGGLRAHFVQALAKAQPKLLILAGRSEQKTQSTGKTISSANSAVAIKTLDIELSSQKSVRQAAAVVSDWDDVPAIDVLVNNAGIMARPYELSPEGIEMHLAANHVGPFLFTNLIMKKLLASSQPRIVNVASDGHRLSWMRWADYNFDNGKTYNKWRAYGQSKTANMLFTLSLAHKLGKQGLTAVSLHPGVIGTNLGDHLSSFDALIAADRELGNAEGWGGLNFIEPQRGVATHVYGAFDPAMKDCNGAYLIDTRFADPTKDTYKAHASSMVEADMLWKLSEKLVGHEASFGTEER